MTASEMFGVPVLAKGQPPEVRRRAKAIKLGIIYGVSAPSGSPISWESHREEASAYIKALFRGGRHPGLYGPRQKICARQRLCHDDFRTAQMPIIRALRGVK